MAYILGEMLEFRENTFDKAGVRSQSGSKLQNGFGTAKLTGVVFYAKLVVLYAVYYQSYMSV